MDSGLLYHSQDEGAECYYKQVRIKPIDSMPAEYAHLFE